MEVRKQLWKLFGTKKTFMLQDATEKSIVILMRRMRNNAWCNIEIKEAVDKGKMVAATNEDLKKWYDYI